MRRALAAVLSAVLLLQPLSQAAAQVRAPQGPIIPGRGAILAAPAAAAWSNLTLSAGAGTSDAMARFDAMPAELRGPWAYRLERAGATPGSLYFQAQRDAAGVTAVLEQAWTAAQADAALAADAAMRGEGSDADIAALAQHKAYLAPAAAEAVVVLDAKLKERALSERIMAVTASWRKPGAGAVQASIGGGDTSPKPTSPKPRLTPDVPKPGNGSTAAAPRGGSFWSRIPTWGKVVGGIALVGGLVLGGFYLVGRAGNDFWENSKAAQEIRVIEKARVDRDAAALDAMAFEARARYSRMMERIKVAEARGEKEVELDGGKMLAISKARAYAAFDLVVALRAEVGENAVSNDKEKRIGEVPPADWTSALSELESESARTGFEGPLALGIRALKGELARQEKRASEFDRDVARFEDEVPALFKGKMGHQLERAKGDVKEFRTSEIAAERGALDRSEAAMRGRVSDKHYAKDAGFKRHRDHRDALSAVHAQHLQPVLQAANGVIHDLDEVIRHKRDHQQYLLWATQRTHEHVGNDKDGNPIYEDQSAHWRMMAAQAGAAASAAAGRANGKLEMLRPMIGALHSNPTLKAEGLADALPEGRVRQVNEGSSVFFDWYLDPMWNLFMNMHSESDASRARAEFMGVKGQLEGVAKAVAGRRDREQAAVDQVIDADLSAQMQKAAEKGGAGSR